jgi:uncharacterized protein HemX
MNPILIWRILAAIGSLLGIGGVVYGVDQQQKRKKDHAANRARLGQMEAELAAKERQLAQMESHLGQKNEQVRRLAAEITQLRNAANEMRRSA